MAPTLRLPLAAAVRVIHRVHGRAANGGPFAEPARASGLPARDVGVVDVADLAHRRPAGEEHATKLARREPEHPVVPVLRDELHRGSGRARHATALAGLE